MHYSLNAEMKLSFIDSYLLYKEPFKAGLLYIEIYIYSHNIVSYIWLENDVYRFVLDSVENGDLGSS